MPDISVAVEEAAEGPASASTDGRSATSHPIPDLIKAEAHVTAKEVLAGLNAQGGPRSPWCLTRPARVIPPGTTGPTASS